MTVITADAIQLPNVYITDEANPFVNAVQFGADDVQANLKEQHISTADCTDTGPGAGMTVNPGHAAGTNAAGANLRLGTGESTGNNGAGAVVILTCTAGASGSGLNSQSDAWYFWGADVEKALTPASDNAQDLGYPVLRIRNTFIGGYVEGSEIADPAAPAANTGRLYFRDNGSGKTELVVRFASGAVQVVAIQP